MDTNKENNSKNKNASNEICKGCGWQCPITALSCNKGRRLNGVPEVVEYTATKRASIKNTRAERFLRRLNRQDNEGQGSGQ